VFVVNSPLLLVQQDIVSLLYCLEHLVSNLRLVHILIWMMLERLLQVCSSHVGVAGGREEVEDIVKATLFHNEWDVFPFVLGKRSGVS